MHVRDIILFTSVIFAKCYDIQSQSDTNGINLRVKIDVAIHMQAMNLLCLSCVSNLSVQVHCAFRIQ